MTRGVFILASAIVIAMCSFVSASPHNGTAPGAAPTGSISDRWLPLPVPYHRVRQCCLARFRERSLINLWVISEHDCASCGSFGSLGVLRQRRRERR